MFAVTLRFAAGLAIGAAAALWLARPKAVAPGGLPDVAADLPRTTDPRSSRLRLPERVSEYRKDEDGRVSDNALVDGAVEDTFPASDPPSFMQSVIARPPRQNQKAEKDEIAERHPS